VEAKGALLLAALSAALLCFYVSRSRLTEWRIRALSCQRIQFRLEEAQADGSWKLVAEGRPVSLTLGEPDPRLFEEGAGYVELKPSERVRRQVTRLGHPEAMADWAKWAEREDKMYTAAGATSGAPDNH
jgi:hypothetical protein